MVIVYFHECKTFHGFAVICFRQNTQRNEILYVFFAAENNANTFEKIPSQNLG